MKLIKKTLLVGSLCLALSPLRAFSEDVTLTPGIHDDSEAGVVVVSGNSKTQTYNLLQANIYNWDENTLKFIGKFLETETSSVTTAKNWTASLRYDRQISPRFGLFVGQAIESDVFSGYLQRYVSNLGGKYAIIKDDAFYWNGEAGYRYAIENRQTGQVNQSYIRLYTEANYDWTKTFSTKYWIEGLPNLSNSSDYQINTQLSGNAAINTSFAIQVAYLVRYRNTLVGNATVKTDTQFSTSLVAKF
jgi:putative salt-induced outer membrane protein YdiY